MKLAFEPNQEAVASIMVYGQHSESVSVCQTQANLIIRFNVEQPFNPEENPLNAPIVQVSVFDTENPDQHYNLGRVVSSPRSENIQIIVSGMAVHNLQELQLGMVNGRSLPYATSFDKTLKDAATASPHERQAKKAALLKRMDARKAHPTFDHLLPIFVGADAASDDRGVQPWTLSEGSMSWAQYRFGDVPPPV